MRLPITLKVTEPVLLMPLVLPTVPTVKFAVSARLSDPIALAAKVPKLLVEVLKVNVPAPMNKALVAEIAPVCVTVPVVFKVKVPIEDIPAKDSLPEPEEIDKL